MLVLRFIKRLLDRLSCIGESVSQSRRLLNEGIIDKDV